MQDKKYQEMSETLMGVFYSKNGKQKFSNLIEMLFDDALLKAILDREKFKSARAVIKNIWGLNDKTLKTCDVCEKKDVLTKIKFENIKDKIKICMPCLDDTNELIKFIIKSADKHLKNKLSSNI